LEREVNFQQNPYNTFIMLPHYIAKEVRVLAYLEENANEYATCIEFWTHPIFTYLLVLSISDSC